MGLVESVKLGAGITVRPSVVVRVKLPDVPVIVTVTVPVAAVALAVRVSVPLVVAGFGLNAAVTPLGKPEAETVTFPLKPKVADGGGKGCEHARREAGAAAICHPAVRTAVIHDGYSLVVLPVYSRASNLLR